MSRKTKEIRNVLVMIDPAQDSQYALQRAIMMNKLLKGGVNIHLFISYEMDRLRKGQASYEFYCDSKWLTELVYPLVEQKITYTAEVYWSENWHRSVLEAAERHETDLIILSDYTTEKNETDLSGAKWSLLRTSQCPVLIAHPTAELQRKTILAAVNMQTSNPRYVELNQEILRISRLMAESYGAEKHIVNAYEDSMEYPDRSKLLRDTEAEQKNVHVQMGDPTTIIATVADEIDADVVVIGTLARRGIMAAMRGNRSEKIIHQLNRDVMVVNCANAS